MKYKRIKQTFGVGIATGLLAAAASVLASDTTNIDNLSPAQILKKAVASYASLTSYSDQGQIVTDVDGSTRMTTFATRLARPGYYLVVWQRDNAVSVVNENPTQQQAVWSSGAGDYWEAGYGPQSGGSPEIALDAASALSGGASTTIPMTFLNLQLRVPIDGNPFEEHRRPDEKVGAVNCYVLSHESLGKTTTLWIGQQDFLIRQIQTAINADAIQATVSQVPNEKPGLAIFLHDYTCTETHANIVTNAPLAKSNFIPVFSHFASPPDVGDDNGN
jgi:hypothetical protein